MLNKHLHNNRNETLLVNKEQYKQQCRVVKELCQLKLMNERLTRTRIFKERLKTLKNSEYDNSLQIKEIKKNHQSSIDLIDFVLKNMKPINSWLIQNSYLKDKTEADVFWYEEYFSKTTFYKKRKAAIKEFMEHYFDYQYRSE